MYSFNQRQYTGLSPIIKWAGGKEKELSFILPNAPQEFEAYYEPFVGGGSVFAAFPAKHHFINDKSHELIRLYRCIATKDAEFFMWMEEINSAWHLMQDFANKNRELCTQYLEYRSGKISDAGLKTLVATFIERQKQHLDKILSNKFEWYRGIYACELEKNLTRKIARMKKIEREKQIMPDSDIFDNIETALMSALYMYFRTLYNDHELMRLNSALGTAVFTFIRNYAYSGMFRYNDKGVFNVPYGGMAYNHKSLDKKLAYYKSAKLQSHFSTTSISNLDFEEFLRSNPPQDTDFVFLDPPYDSEFSTYAQNEFSQDDQRRLANYLINECRGKWMMVIKNTPFIYSLYDNPKLTIKSFDKKYIVSFMNRNDKNAEHLIIMNY